MNEAATEARWEESWRAFQGAPATLGPDPGVREAWRRGRERYAVWLLRVNDPAVRARVARVRAAFDGELVPVADQDLHITVWVAGFPTDRPALDDDIDEAVLGRQAHALREAAPVRLAVGGLHPFLTCLVLRVDDPHDDLGALRRRLALGPPELRFGPWLPHITVGRFPAVRPTAELTARVGALRWRAALPVCLREIELVELDACRWDAPLQARWRIPLGAAA